METSPSTYPRSSNEGLGKRALATIHFLGGITFLLLKVLWLLAEETYRMFVPLEEKSVKGEIVLITGAGHGIGKELALQYASQEAIVVCWDINNVTNLETVEEIAKLGYPKAHAYECNVAKREDVMEAARKVQKEVGDVTILINNAGIMPCHSFFDHTAKEITDVINVNVMAHYWTIQAFLPAMKKNNHGHIVAISSGAGLIGLRNTAAYSASKYAIRGMMEALLHELRTDKNCNVKTTIIYPYGVNTGLCRTYRISFKWLMALLDPRDVAKYVMSAQRRNAVETSIPVWNRWALIAMRLFPVKTILAIEEFLDSAIESDL